MNTITATELRTKTPELIETLANGYTVDFIHRSRIIGEIKPKEEIIKLFDAKKMGRLVNALNLPKLSDKEIERRYRKHIMEKYGKDLPRHK